MAKTTTTEIRMPDPKTWAAFEVAPKKIAGSEPHGRVIGLDYETWAVAWEDATQKPARIAARAQKLEAKGFVELTGQTLIVHGVDSPARVWVMPRDLYEKRRHVRDQELVDRVRAGLYPGAATAPGYTRSSRD